MSLRGSVTFYETAQLVVTLKMVVRCGSRFDKLFRTRTVPNGLSVTIIIAFDIHPLRRGIILTPTVPTLFPAVSWNIFNYLVDMDDWVYQKWIQEYWQCRVLVDRTGRRMWVKFPYTFLFIRKQWSPCASEWKMTTANFVRRCHLVP